MRIGNAAKDLDPEGKVDVNDYWMSLGVNEYIFSFLFIRITSVIKFNPIGFFYRFKFK